MLTRSLRLLLVVPALIAVSALHLVAQDTPVRRTISVTGEAEVRVVPDEAVITFGIETSSDKAIDNAREENDRRLEELLALTRRLGIKPEHVQTDYLDIEPRYDYDSERRERKFLGYFIQRNVVITLRDLTKFTPLLTDALKLGVNRAGQVQFRTTELRKHRDAARTMAIRAAKEKAVDLAKELGMKVGKPITIEESSTWDTWGGPRRGMMMQNAMSEESMGGDMGSSTLAPGQISVSARVSVTFDLE
jgi:uncharacterized protein